MNPCCRSLASSVSVWRRTLLLRPDVSSAGFAPITSRKRDWYHRYLSSSSDNQDESRSANKNRHNLDPRLTEWIPPDRHLVGDKGNTHLYHGYEKKKDEAEMEEIEREVKLLQEEDALTEEEKLQRIEEEARVLEDAEEEEKRKRIPVKPAVNNNNTSSMDWLATRREALKKQQQQLIPSFDSPDDAVELKVLHHTLLTADEIMGLLQSLGGIRPNLIMDPVQNEHGDTRMGGALRGMIFVSGNSTAHIRMMANSLVEQLKLRKLDEVGVMGARHGAEGAQDDEATWMCVDCHNYSVNIQDEPTRRLLDLEAWWSHPGDPLYEYNKRDSNNQKYSRKKKKKKKHRNDDEDAMDDFVALNPVPPEYGRSSVRWDTELSISQLEKKRFTAPHRPVLAKPRRRKQGKKKKKRKY